MELEEHFSSADGWQCNYCMDIIPCDTKGMNGHLEECQEYKNENKPSCCPNCDGTGICKRCVKCDGASGCVYCVLEDCDDIVPRKDCILCKGTGKVDGND